jgi:hypothetical protein
MNIKSPERPAHPFEVFWAEHFCISIGTIIATFKPEFSSM